MSEERLKEIEGHHHLDEDNAFVRSYIGRNVVWLVAECRRQSSTIADLAANNVELVHQVQRLEQELRGAKKQ